LDQPEIREPQVERESVGWMVRQDQRVFPGTAEPTGLMGHKESVEAQDSMEHQEQRERLDDLSRDHRESRDLLEPMGAQD
jgi:hypothetical protein